VTSVEDRLAALESRVRELEARMGGASPSSAAPPADPAGSVAWLDQVAALAKQGDRAGAIALYQQKMESDEREAASFVDDLIAQPPSGS
jgi:hypothetical protein